MLVDVVDGGHETLVQLLLLRDADMFQHEAGELGEEAFDEIEPGAILGRESEREAGCCHPFNAFRALLAIAAGAVAPTFDGLYSKEWADPTSKQAFVASPTKACLESFVLAGFLSENRWPLFGNPA